MMNFIEILALVGVISYREVGHLCQRKSWDWNNFKNLYWTTNQNNFWIKNFDWFHVSNGLMTLFIIHLLAQALNIIKILNQDLRIIVQVVGLWLIWMYLRNIMMHVIIPKWHRGNRNLRLWYLIPLIGAWFDYNANK